MACLCRVKSTGAIVAILLNLFAFSAHFALLWALTEVHGTWLDSYLVPVAIVSLVTLAIACPVAGWLADSYYGRYRVLQTGLIISWIGMLTMTITAIADPKEHLLLTIIHVTGGICGFILILVGSAAYGVNAIQFGIDQMPDASSEDICTYVNRFVWTMFAGYVIAELTSLMNYCNPKNTLSLMDIETIQLLVPTSILSIALCCVFLLRKHLIIEPGGSNSLRTVVGVLRFAARNKRPLRRRAITFTENVIPTRIDFAKNKYGGPYTTEQVEDLKTFFRIIAVILSTYLVVNPALLFSISLNALEDLQTGECISTIKKYAHSSSVIAFVLLPLYRTVLHPILKRHKVFSILMRLVIAGVILVELCGIMLTVNSIAHSINTEIPCMFNSDQRVFIPPMWLIVPLKLALALELVLYFKAVLEFICAQSPYPMRGALSGLLMSIISAAPLVSYAIFHSWRNIKAHILPSCDFYYFLFQFLCSLIGLIVFCLVAYLYKRRKRQDVDNQQAIVEGIFDRMLHQRNESESEVNNG